MTRHVAPWAAAALLLAACEAPVEAGREAGREGGAATRAVPDAVRELAAPYQDVSTARVLEEDGCYWYRHVGPVETTLLPLRTAEGRRICARPPQETAPEAGTASRAALSFAR